MSFGELRSSLSIFTFHLFFGLMSAVLVPWHKYTLEGSKASYFCALGREATFTNPILTIVC